MQPVSKPQSNPRVVVLYGVVALMMAMFVARLWQMQVIEAGRYETLADSNRFRTIAIDAPRGIIYDRAGALMARNAPAYDVTIVPAQLPDGEENEMAVYRRLSELLGMPISSRAASLRLRSPLPSVGDFAGQALPFRAAGGRGIKDIVDEARGIAPYRPVTVRSNVPRDVALQIAEENLRLPGVKTVIVSSREYPAGLLASHVVGYTSRVSVDLVDQLEQAMIEMLSDMGQESVTAFYQNVQAAKNHNPDTDRVGLTGVEATHEDWLHGTKGERNVEEDVAGREIRTVGTPIDPAPGHNLYLTIDRELQQVALEALQQQIDQINTTAGTLRTKRGAVVAMDPRNGQVLALVSLPTYDNNLFARGITFEEYEALLNEPFLPIFNHAIGDQVQPGSVFKIIPAASALQEEIVTLRWTWYDSGSIVVPNKYFPNDPRQAQTFFGWYRQGFGNTNIVAALANSVNTFFYVTVGGLDVPGYSKVKGFEDLNSFLDYVRAFGLGRLTGIDLPGEAPGHVPDSQWKRLTYGENWSLGDTYNLSIGEGFLTATPIQILNATAAVANGGTLYKPEVVLRITDADGNEVESFRPHILHALPINPDNLAIVREGMQAAVQWGTAQKAQVAGLNVAGKTGTAEFCDDLAQRLGFCAAGLPKPTHAWFTAYAPADDPQIALVVYIYNGGEGSQVAAPVAQKILQFWHDRQASGGSATNDP